MRDRDCWTGQTCDIIIGIYNTSNMNFIDMYKHASDGDDDGYYMRVIRVVGL